MSLSIKVNSHTLNNALCISEGVQLCEDVFVLRLDCTVHQYAICHRYSVCLLHELSGIFSIWLNRYICGYRYVTQKIYCIKIVYRWYLGNAVMRLAIESCISYLTLLIFKFISRTDIWSISCTIAHCWMPQGITNSKPTLVHAMAWCLQATSHCMSQQLSTYGVTMPQWVNSLRPSDAYIRQ